MKKHRTRHRYSDTETRIQGLIKLGIEPTLAREVIRIHNKPYKRQPMPITNSDKEILRTANQQMMSRFKV